MLAALGPALLSPLRPPAPGPPRVHLQDDSRRKLCSAGGWTAKTSTAEEYAGLTIGATRHWSHLMVRPVTLL